MGVFSCHGVEPGEDAYGEECVNDKINQDRGCVVCPYRGTKNDSLFMVLDGHGDQGTPPPTHSPHSLSFPRILRYPFLSVHLTISVSSPPQGDRLSEFTMRQIAISLEKHPQLSEDPVTALTETFVNTNQALLGKYLSFNIYS